MSLTDIVRHAQSMPLFGDDGKPLKLSLLPPLSDSEFDAYSQKLPCSLPVDVAELLRFCRGFEFSHPPMDNGLDGVDLNGEFFFEFAEVFPFGVPIAEDGCGNYWVVDLTPESRDFGPVYYACHDAPVILYQSETLAEFFTEVLKMCVPPHQSLVDDVYDDRIRNVWSDNPGVLDYDACRGSMDPVLSGFAATLDESWQVIDLRKAKPGDGFSWGRYGASPNIRRYGPLPVFACQIQIRKGFLQWLFGG